MKNLSLFFSLLIIFSVSHKGSSQTVNGVPITPEMIEEYKKSQNSSTNAQQSPSPTKTNNQENSDVRPSDINNILTDTITILHTIYLDKPIQESLEPKKIKIHGHTNGGASGKIIGMGKDSDNFFSLNNTSESIGSAKKLSGERAEIIKQFLVSNGVSEKRMEVKAWGGKRPIHDKHATRAQENVRVEIEILEDK